MRKRTNKNSCIEFHNSYFIIALGFILTGHFLNLIIFTSLILFHELGHYLTALFLNIEVKKIMIYPFGGITKLNSMINLDIKKELLVASSGVIMQHIFYIIIINLPLRNYTKELYTMYNSQIIFFNLMPIYPLDGSKIIQLLLSSIIPLRITNILTIITSIITILFLLYLNIYTMNYSNIMIYIILATYIIKFYQIRKYIYHKFLLERYLYNFNFAKTKIIKNYHNMYKNKKHLIYNKGELLREKDILKQIFTK